MNRRGFLAASAVGVAAVTAGCTNSLPQTSGPGPDEDPETKAATEYGADESGATRAEKRRPKGTENRGTRRLRSGAQSSAGTAGS